MLARGRFLRDRRRGAPALRRLTNTQIGRMVLWPPAGVTRYCAGPGRPAAPGNELPGDPAQIPSMGLRTAARPQSVSTDFHRIAVGLIPREPGAPIAHGTFGCSP